MSSAIATADAEIAKKIAETPEQATANDFGGGLVVTGRKAAQMTLSRVVMYSGTTEEETRYGRHERGVFIDALEARELGDKINIMPFMAQAKFAEWVEGETSPVRTWDSEDDVPAGLLDWQDGPGGDKKNRIPPAVSESVEAFCIVQSIDKNGVVSTEPFPYLFVFKSTGLPAFNRTIGPLEDRRAMTNKCPGLYRLSSKDDTNGKRQSYKRLVATPQGDPPSDVVAMAKVAYKAAKQLREKATELSQSAPGDSGGGFDPNSYR